MRAFIALEIPEKIKREIGQIQDQLKKSGIQAKWVNPEIAHLTLAFLGSITPDKVESIGKILKETASQIAPINLRFSKIGCFPTPGRPRIIFVSLEDELDKLNILATKIRKELKKANIYFDEKPFSPHFTLGRTKRKQDLTNFLKAVKIKGDEFVVKEVTLNKSVLSSFGPIYTKLKCASLI